jgi:hypothetical protein
MRGSTCALLFLGTTNAAPEEEELLLLLVPEDAFEGDELGIDGNAPVPALARADIDAW